MRAMKRWWCKGARTSNNNNKWNCQRIRNHERRQRYWWNFISTKIVNSSNIYFVFYFNSDFFFFDWRAFDGPKELRDETKNITSNKQKWGKEDKTISAILCCLLANEVVWIHVTFLLEWSLLLFSRTCNYLCHSLRVFVCVCLNDDFTVDFNFRCIHTPRDGTRIESKQKKCRFSFRVRNFSSIENRPRPVNWMKHIENMFSFVLQATQRLRTRASNVLNVKYRIICHARVRVCTVTLNFAEHRTNSDVVRGTEMTDFDWSNEWSPVWCVDRDTF